MPVNAEYAGRTACREHAKICTKELRGSIRYSFYSECEGRRMYSGCKFSHTIFNTKRVLKLGGESQDFVVKLNYGYGFERYGAYDGWASGWEVEVNKRSLGSVGSHQKTNDLPESLLLAESNLGIKAKGSPEVEYEKTQSLCLHHYQHSRCSRADCRYDHDLIDAKRVEHLVRWPQNGMSPNYEYMSVECRSTAGRIRWKIVMKEAAFATLGPTDPLARSIPSLPYSYEDEDLLTVIRHMEGIVGITTSTAN